jgi:hypothetical protein
MSLALLRSYYLYIKSFYIIIDNNVNTYVHLLVRGYCLLLVVFLKLCYRGFSDPLMTVGPKEPLIALPLIEL